MLCANSLAVVTWKDHYWSDPHMVDALAGQLQQYRESLSSSCLVCVSAVENLSQQFKNGMFYLSLLWTSIWATWSKCSSAQDGEHSGHTPWATGGFTCVTTESTSRSGTENLPQPGRHRYVSCEEKQSQRGVLPRKIADKKSGQCSTSVLIHGYLMGVAGLQQWKQRNWQDRQNPFGLLGCGKMLLPGERT